MVPSSKYMEKRRARSLRSNASASFDHLLNDVTALGKPNSRPK
jgi:hypothetical protein